MPRAVIKVAAFGGGTTVEPVGDAPGGADAAPLGTGGSTLVQVTVPVEAALTGNQVAGEDLDDAVLVAGDTAAGLVRHAALSFALPELPPSSSIRRLYSAMMIVLVCNVGGDPTSLAFSFERVSFTSRADIDAPVLLGMPSGASSDIPLIASVGLDVAADFFEVWSQGGERLQYRFSPSSSDGDAVADLLYLRRFDDEDDSLVHPDVIEPSPGAGARIELSYFE